MLNHQLIRKILLLILVVPGCIALGHWYEPLRSLTPLLGVAVYLWLFRKEGFAIIKASGDTIILQKTNAKNTTSFSKKADVGISEIIEWEGYEGTILDVVWNDKEVWSLTVTDGLNSRELQSTLEKCGLGKIPIRKDYRVFRPCLEVG